ncbi:MAG: family 20 glycosylhydrolase [Phycisphaeraceae bacterium]|nr:family 20 glycosylhydrolase [Phycisphaeraceae bacterium]
MMTRLLICLTILQAGFLNAQEISLVPQPTRVDPQKGVFTLDGNTRIICTRQCQAEASWLKSHLTHVTGLDLALSTGKRARRNAIQLTIDPSLDMKTDEGYTLTVKASRVDIRATGKAGIFYGIQTLRQLLPVDTSARTAARADWAVPCVEITDQPSYPWRAMMLDVSRYFFDKDYVKRYLDIMASHKLNVLHLHLVDDPGWRVAISKYPKLTEVGAFRGKGEKRYGGYYTKDDIREFVAYAAKLHIDIVPEIELPAHIQSALVAYPWLGCTGQALEVPTTQYISKEILCAGRESTYQFLEDVMAEVVELFPFKYIHIGGDEAKYDRWKACEHCQAKFKAEGMSELHELQGTMTRRIEKFLSSKDRCMIGWDEITSMGLSPDAAVMTWHRPETAVKAAQAGNKVVMALTGHAYFDTPESKLPGEPPAATWLPPITLKKAYEWEPAPAVLKGQARKNILGAHGCMWTDRFMHNPILQDVPALNEERSYDYVEYLSLPRMAALAEVTWTPQDQRGWLDFEQRMKQQYNRYSQTGYNFRVPLPKVSKPVKADQGYRITAECLVDRARICYTTDGTYPNSYSRVYEKPILVNDPQKFQAITVVNERHVSLAFSFPKDKP